MASPAHDASKDSSGESTPGGEEKRDEKDGKEPSASPMERPSRERKSVVRYAAAAPRRLLVKKAVTVQQGSGEKLKDIPNVAFKLSKRKSDESLRVLHNILFGGKSKVHFLKKNILQFSGFVWSQNEEKDRLKVKEKLNKCNKEKLLEYCDLLDVYTLKATMKKEEIKEKLLEFLECPHTTREVILSEKEKKGKKRGRGERPLEEAAPDREKKRPKKDENFETKKDWKKPAKVNRGNLVKSISIDTDLGYENKKDDAEETSVQSYSEAEDDNAHDEPESAKILSGEEMNVNKEPKSKGKSPTVRKVSRAKSKAGQSASNTPTKKANGKAKVLSENKTSKMISGSSKEVERETLAKKSSKDNSTRKVFQKKGEPGSGSSNRSTEGKIMGKSEVRISAKKSKNRVAKSALKGKHEDALVEPSRESLHDVVTELLKEVDFNVVTLADIIKQLGAHFDTDLMPRKTEIKAILEDVINNMTDDEEDGDDDGDGSAEK